MSIWEMVTLWGLMATILGVFLTFYGIINNKTFKKESQLTREILHRIDKGQEESRREFRETMNRMERGQQENRMEVVRIIERITEKIAELIVAEGEKTRDLVVKR